MPGDGGRHAVRRILPAPGAQNPGNSESGEAAYYMNRARSRRIDESVTEPVIGAELREPAAPPDPMRKKRVGPASQNRGGSATRRSRQRSAPLPSGINAAKPTEKICNNAARDAGEPSKAIPRKKNGSAAIQFQLFPTKART